MDARIVGVDAGDFGGIADAPMEFVGAALAHSDEGGLGGQAVLGGKEVVEAVPAGAGVHTVGGDVADVEATAEEFDFGLRFVVPIAAAPGPGKTGGGSARGHNHDSASAVGDGAVGVFRFDLLGRSGNGSDVASGVVEDVVVAGEAFVPSAGLAGEGSGDGGSGLSGGS